MGGSVSLINGHIDNDNRCVCCGKPIPEGRQYCVICGYKVEQKQTNYDRIRNMSVEELVDFMQRCGWDFPPYCDYQKAIRGICNQNCKECAKQWLEQEVEE